MAAVERAADCAGVRVVLTNANDAMNDGDCVRWSADADANAVKNQVVEAQAFLHFLDAR